MTVDEQMEWHRACMAAYIKELQEWRFSEQYRKVMKPPRISYLQWDYEPSGYAGKTNAELGA